METLGLDLALLNSTYGIYLTAFLVGLLGGVHCLGMCGGIVGALTFGLPPEQRNRPATLFPILLAYNTGRISSYVLVGALAGGIGAALLSMGELDAIKSTLHIIAALFMIALGLYLANIWHGLSHVEKLGRYLWKHIEPVGRKLLPINTPMKALPMGFLWGWLPCGLVYSVVIWAVSIGSMQQGALLLLAFGLGTLPNLLLMGAASSYLAKWTRNRWIKLVAGLLIVAMGIMMLLANHHH